MRLLLVEDQPLIGKAVKKGLSEEAFAVDWATSVADGLHLAGEFEYDTVVLDLMLPDGSGLDILAKLRSEDCRTPVLILTAKETLPDKIAGFALGADDYLTKPFAFEELLSRVRALTRRKYQHYRNILEIGPLKIDTTARMVKYGENSLPLTAKEFAVLELFGLRRNQVLSRDKIAQHIYAQSSEIGSNVIDVFINRLRRKLESAGVSSLIQTVRGEGYVVR